MVPKTNKRFFDFSLNVYGHIKNIVNFRDCGVIKPRGFKVPWILIETKRNHPYKVSIN
jgi:hypothetical protein